MKKFVMMAVCAMLTQAALAFPTWMGTYGIYKKHDDRANPGLFSIMMNQDYVGLKAEVGIQVNGGNWVMYPMTYVANINGNSLWTFMPSFQFPGGATVKYFFHGSDNWGGNIWDSRNGLNYEFVTSPSPELPVQRMIDSVTAGDYTNANGITYMRPWNMALDIKVKDLGAPEAVGILWTWNNWADYRSASAVYESDLGGGFQQWGVDLLPAGFEYSHRSLGFIRWFPAGSTNVMNVTSGRVDIVYAIFYKVNGTWYWDNNGGKDYRLTVGAPPVNPGDTDNDGLLDTWEMENIGSLSQSALDNFDNDGQPGFPMANIIEMANGTNPSQPEDTSGRGVGLIWANAYPSKGGTVTLSYGMGNQGNPLFGKPIYAHVGYNGWKGVYQSAQLVGNGQTGRFDVTINVPADATEINVVFTDKAGSWDNNGGRDWKIPVRP